MTPLEVGSTKHLEFCRLRRVCLFVAKILKQKHRGFLFVTPDKPLCCMWFLGDKKKSNNCFVFRQASVLPVYFLITTGKNVFQTKCCCTHYSFKSPLSWYLCTFMCVQTVRWWWCAGRYFQFFWAFSFVYRKALKCRNTVSIICVLLFKWSQGHIMASDLFWERILKRL